MTPTDGLVRGVAALALLAAAACGGGQSASGGASAGSPASAGQVAVRVGDRAFTLDDIDRRALAVDAGAFSGLALRQALYEARRRTIDEMIAEELFAREAQARGISPEALVQQKVMSGIAPVQDADIAAWYQENRNRVGDAPLDQVRAQIRQYLHQQRVSRASAALIERLKATTKVDVALEPPRVALTIPKDAPALGPASAPVQVVEFSDFQCPYCAQVASFAQRVADTYGDRVRFVFRNFPLPNHPQAPKAGEAARCAHAQGKFWAYHDRLFANRQALLPGDLKRYARDLGLDAAVFGACLDGGTSAAVVQTDLREGREYGVTATPTFFINGRLMSGAQPFEAFARVIDEELARTR